MTTVERYIVESISTGEVSAHAVEQRTGLKSLVVWRVLQVLQKRGILNQKNKLYSVNLKNLGQHSSEMEELDEEISELTTSLLHGKRSGESEFHLEKLELSGLEYKLVKSKLTELEKTVQNIKRGQRRGDVKAKHVLMFALDRYHSLVERSLNDF